MGEAIGGLPEASALGDDARSIGAYLRRQRKLRGLSLGELEAATRVPRRSLERLEAGAYDRDPDGFARGFVRTVAEAIGLDPEETVARMLAEAVHPERPRSLAGGWLAWVGLGVLAAALVLVAAGAVRTAARLGERSEEAPVVLRRHDAVRALAEEAAREPVGPPLPADP